MLHYEIDQSKSLKQKLNCYERYYVIVFANFRRITRTNVQIADEVDHYIEIVEVNNELAILHGMIFLKNP